MSANELDYSRLYGNIDLTNRDITMAKCNCTKCNSCACGRCERCISQCTGCRQCTKCKNSVLIDELEWEVA